MPIKYDIKDIRTLTRVQSGDESNSVFLSFLSDNELALRDQLDKMLKHIGHTRRRVFDEVIDSIFSSDDMTEDRRRKITLALTVYDAYYDLVQEEPSHNPNDLFFATLVNYQASHSGAICKICSEQQLSAAKEYLNNNGSDPADYREYVVNGNPELNFNKENGKVNAAYETIKIEDKSLLESISSPDITIEIPIIKLKLGFFRLATEHVAARMTFCYNSEETLCIIPPHMWLKMLQGKLAKRASARFMPFEKSILHKYFEISKEELIKILEINNYNLYTQFLNDYNYEFVDYPTDCYTIAVHNTDEPATLYKDTLIWEDNYIGDPRSYVLIGKNNKYFLQDALIILMNGSVNIYKR